MRYIFSILEVFRDEHQAGLGDEEKLGVFFRVIAYPAGGGKSDLLVDHCAAHVTASPDMGVMHNDRVLDHGTRADIEGEYRAGETVVLIDDLATTGGSKFEAIDKLKAEGLQVRDVVVLIDRQSGAREILQQSGYVLHAVTTITQLLDHWEQTGRVSADRIGAARQFVSDSVKP